MKNNKKVILAFGLVLGYGLISNNTWGMEQQAPIYEILAKKKINEKEQVFKERGFQTFDLKELYPRLLEAYKEYESSLEEIKHLPTVSIWGGINYAMTLEEMKQKIKATFSEMKKNGLIISKDEFESIKDKYFFHHKHFFHPVRKDLTRIWGAEYLKNIINASPYLSKKYGIPQYVIVLDDPYKMSVTISFKDKYFPIVKDLNNGEIYFEEIKGYPVASPWRSAVKDIGIESGIGYADFNDPGNIIQQWGTDRSYIVDLEFKSFEIPISYDLQDLLEYASGKFKYLNPQYSETNEIYEFDL